MARPRIRTHHCLLVFSPFTSLGWRVTRRIDVDAGERMVQQGRFRRIVDDRGEHIGYQPVGGEVQATPSADRSSAALRAAEIRANAGLMGRSRTAHLSDEQRLTRVHPKSGRLLPQEDFVERVSKLMQVYPRSANFAKVHGRTGDRAVRVYPKMPEAQRAAR